MVTRTPFGNANILRHPGAIARNRSMLAVTRVSMIIAACVSLATACEAGLFTRSGHAQNAQTGASCATPATISDCAAPSRQAPVSFQRTSIPVLNSDGCTPVSPATCWPVGPAEGDVSCTGSCISLCDDELRKLIVESKTGSSTRHRRLAVHIIGTRFKCNHHSQVMPALVYALNDIDETVRAKAADKIGDQLRESPCCCAPYVLQALRLSLSDSSSTVRIQAEQALVACGREVVDPGTRQLHRDQCVGCAPFVTAPALTAPALTAPAAVAPEAVAPEAIPPALMSPSALPELPFPAQLRQQTEFSRLEIQERPVFEELPIPQDRVRRRSDMTTVVPAPLTTKPAMVTPSHATGADEPQFLPPKIGIAPREGQSIR